MSSGSIKSVDIVLDRADLYGQERVRSKAEHFCEKPTSRFPHPGTLLNMQRKRKLNTCQFFLILPPRRERNDSSNFPQSRTDEK